MGGGDGGREKERNYALIDAFYKIKRRSTGVLSSLKKTPLTKEVDEGWRPYAFQ